MQLTRNTFAVVLWEADFHVAFYAAWVCLQCLRGVPCSFAGTVHARQISDVLQSLWRVYAVT